MKIYSINSYDCKPRNVISNNTSFGSKKAEPKELPQVSSNSGSHALRNTAYALMFLIPTGVALSSCTKDDEDDHIHITYTDRSSASASAYASGTATAQVIVGPHKGDSCDCHHGRDTVYINNTDWDTVYVDTGSYHHTTDTIIKWKERYDRPIPLDTLAKHLTIWDIDGADTTGNRNVIHYEYTRPWEYNTRVVANMNQLESGMNKKVLVHDVEVFDYKGNHKYYGKEIRRVPEYPITLEYYNGNHVNTDKGIFLELHKNKGDRAKASIFGGTSLQERYFLQTAGDSVKVFKENENGVFVEDGRATKGYLGQNTILLKDLIGDYSTEDHLTDIKVVSVSDEVLRDAYVRAKDEEEATEGK